MSAYSIQSTLHDSFLPDEDDRHVLNVSANAATYDDLPQDPVYDVEDLDSQVNNAQEQLKRLRDEQEALQRKKAELEALNAKQSEFQEGRADVVTKLTNSTTEFEHEAHLLVRRAEAMQLAARSFRQHLDMIETIRPEGWAQEGMHHELDRALDVIGSAREDYDDEMRRIEALGGSAAISSKSAKKGKFFKMGRRPAAASGDQSFFYWLRSGFAFNLPVIVLGAIALMLILAALGGPTPAEPTAIETAATILQP